MASLKRNLGFWRAYATATGLVVAGSTMVSLGNGFGTIGPAFIVAAFVAMIISILIALSYAELSSILPGAGMIGDYTSVAMGRFFAIIAVLGGYLVLTVTVGPLETLTASAAVQHLFPSVNTIVIAFVLLFIFLIINILGVEIFGTIQLAVVLILMIGTASFGVFGLLDVGTVNASVASEFNPFGWSTVFQAFAMGLWLFIGIEYVIPLGDEVKNPEKTIPLAMICGLLTIFVVDMLFGFALTRHMSLDVLSASATPQIDGAVAMFGQIGGIIMSLLTMLAAISTINSSFAAVPRMFYGLARQGLLPKVFQYVHPKFRTPSFSIVFVFLLFGLPLFIVESTITMFTTLLLSASITWLISYIIAQINVLILRKRYPQMARPFKAPFTPFTQIIGIAFCVYMIATIHPDPLMKSSIYTIAFSLLLCIAVYAVVWLKYKKLPLFKPVPIEEMRQLKVDLEVPEVPEKIENLPLATPEKGW
ncbi:MAG: APC family permease [Solibacillus sp.]